ncbi:MAG TPA: FAD-dependent oxidoreductase [Casimicrobiaceae bacterium]|nr:FAD-dependent oxidoreductase [Casimicrobiaceae bacterium]
MKAAFDTVVVGGGVMGAAAALRLAEGGMRVALCEARQLGMGASGVNAGTLSIQTKRVPLIPYAVRGYELWKQAGDAVGFKETGSLTLAYNESEAHGLRQRMTARRNAGAPIEFITAAAARSLEPRIREGLAAASFCAADGYANASLTGVYYRSRLRAAGVDVRELTPAQRIVPGDQGVRVYTPAGMLRARRALLATGAWAKTMAEQIGVPLPIRLRVNTVSVTERMPKLIHAVIAHASGMLTLKQAANGTVLIGGAWQGRGSPDDWHGDIAPESLIANLRLAQFVLPELAGSRVVRCWTGFEAQTPDSVPLAGPMPGANNVFVLCCVRSGYTIGPYIGALMADAMLGHEPELPLFDPARLSVVSAQRSGAVESE